MFRTVITASRIFLPFLIIIHFNLCVLGVDDLVKNSSPETEISLPGYQNFWRRFPEIFGPEKWYSSENRNKAKQDRIFEQELARRFRERSFSISPETSRTLKLFQQRYLSRLVFQNEIQSRIDISEEAIRREYRENRTKFIKEEYVNLGHIFVETQPDYSPEQIQKKENIITEAYQSIKNGMTFEEAARKYSEAKSADKGGKAGHLKRGQALPPLEKAAFSLENGELSPVIQTKYGFHILKSYGHFPENLLSFNEARDLIYRNLRDDKELQKLHNFLLNFLKDTDTHHRFYGERMKQPSSNTVVLEWGKRSFTYGDLKKRTGVLRGMSEDEKNKPLWPLLIQEEILADYARENGYHQTPAFRTAETWVENYLLSGEYIQKKIIPEIEVTDKELRRHYEENRERFLHPEKSRALLVTASPAFPSNPVKRHKMENEWKERFEKSFSGCQSPEEFRKIADNLQRDFPEKVKFDDTGLVVSASRGRSYDQAMDKLGSGEISAPFMDGDRVYIMMSLEKKPARVQKYTEAKPRVKKSLIAVEKRKRLENLRKEIIKKLPPSE